MIDQVLGDDSENINNMKQMHKMAIQLYPEMFKKDKVPFLRGEALVEMDSRIKEASREEAA